MQTAIVVGILVIAAVFVLRSFFRKARGAETCGCSSCEAAAQCEAAGEAPSDCGDPSKRPREDPGPLG